MSKRIWLILISLFSCLVLCACQQDRLNNPHAINKDKKVTYYSSFSESPKTLDPAKSYASNEAIFIAQIYEPPLQYDYFKRPYQLIPLTAQTMPEITYFNKNWQPVLNSNSNNDIAYTVYTIAIKPGIYYQPHPAFANRDGHYLYLNLTKQQIAHIHQLSDFPKTGTRELTAADYVYEIKRLASPNVQSPVFGVFSDKILGLNSYAELLSKIVKQHPKQYLDLNFYPLAGAKVLDKYHYQIIIKGQYPQFEYWLAMSFFAPIPWEADKFYAQTGLEKNNINFNWYPIGTGPYYLAKNDPNNEIILSKNPNFRGEIFPLSNDTTDVSKGYTAFAGLSIPMIDEFNFTLEKESIPRWVKFMQGYYDASGISSDNFDQSIMIDEQGKAHLSKAMQAKKFNLQTNIATGTFYLGFNMLDPVVGGYSEQARDLRQAISIAVNFEEFIAIFLNGRAVVAQSPIPPGLFGYKNGAQGIDPYVYDWRNGRAIKKSLTVAKALLAKAGYPNGINAKTGRPLVLTMNAVISSNADDKAEYDWFRGEFAKLGIVLNVQSTDYNRFQDKLNNGQGQIFFFGWNADYPDPENFLFLLYGPNGKVKYGGENATNYNNPQFNHLFIKMKNLSNGPERAAVIQQMVAIAQKDAPWVFGIFPIDFSLSQQWVYPNKPSTVINNRLKYLRINPELRQQLQQQWNAPVLWPILIVLLIMIALFMPVLIQYRNKFYKIKAKVKYPTDV